MLIMITARAIISAAAVAAAAIVAVVVVIIIIVPQIRCSNSMHTRSVRSVNFIWIFSKCGRVYLLVWIAITSADAGAVFVVVAVATVGRIIR